MPLRSLQLHAGGDDRTLAVAGWPQDEAARAVRHALEDEPAVLVADLDLDQRRDWLDLFPFLTTRRPDAYAPLT